MKKLCISLAVLSIIILGFVAVFSGKNQTHTEYLRIHIRADSNEEKDQSVKYLVKERVVEFLTPYLIDVKSKEDAEKKIVSLFGGIKAVCDATLKENGFNYVSTVKINNEKFPTRIYGDGSLILNEGFYDALIIELGSGKGDNWWCVVYPPLCFTDTANITYKSKLLEIIKGFTSRR